MSRYCGFISNEWDFPKDGLYEAYDFKKYFEESERKAFLVKIDDELAGFVLLNKIGTLPDTEWNMGEFYILGKFQGKGIAKQVAYQIWQDFIGKWEVSVIPENLIGLAFWRKTISSFTNGHYKEEIKKVEYDKYQPNRYIFSFETNELTSTIDASDYAMKAEIEIEEIDQNQAESLCRSITSDLPEYFGIPSANEQYFKGVRSCRNLAAKMDDQYVGLLSLNFPYSNNSNIYWMAVFKDYQVKGVGGKLIEEACKLARKSNATTMTVETLAPDESDENCLKTYKFYQTLGFKPLIKLKPEGYEWNMVYMAKYLGKE
jgi:predicted acetyltransferase